MRSFLLLALLALPAAAYTPEELMGERHVPAPKCADGVCTMSEADLQFITQRGRLMEEVANRLYVRLQSCRGERGV